MKFLSRFAQAYAWMQLGVGIKHIGISLKNIVLEVAFVVFALLVIVTSPLIALYGTFFPARLFEALRWLGKVN